MEGHVADSWRAIHQKQAAGHETGKPLDAAMGLLIEGKVVGVECDGQSGGLTEAEGHAFAGNGIDGSGGIADEGDVAGGDAAEFAAERDGSTCRAFGL